MTDLLSGIGDFASDAADTAGDLFDSAWDTGASAFSWLEEHPTGASILGGGALGLLSYRQAKREEEREDRYRREDREERDLYGGAASDSVSENPTLTGGTGLLTEGILAGTQVK